MNFQKLTIYIQFQKVPSLNFKRQQKQGLVLNYIKIKAAQLFVDPRFIGLAPFTEFLRLEPEGDFLVSRFNRVGAVDDISESEISKGKYQD